MSKKVVLLRCDGNAEIGLGHITRCIALAKQFRKESDIEVVFAMRNSQLGGRIVEENDFKVIAFSDDDLSTFKYVKWFKETAERVKADTIILDIRDDLPRETIRQMRSEGYLMVTIDDPSERRLECDLAFYPPVPQVDRMEWSNFQGTLYKGWEWVILRNEFSARCIKAKNEVPHILITMGGSDPAGLTLKAVKALETINSSFDVSIVVGRGFKHQAQLQALIQSTKREYRVLTDIRNMACVMAKSDIAVISFGITAYEVAAMGVPAIYLCLTPDHAESATLFEDHSIGLNLGYFETVSNQQIADAIRRYIDIFPLEIPNPPIDGLGARRIVNIVNRLLKGARGNKE